MTRKLQETRRRARLERQNQRRRQLAYLAKQPGTFGLDDRERVELDSLIHRIERAQRAQQTHDRRTDVQLRLAEVA